MTFLHKLARRLAGIHAPFLVLLLTSSCSPGEERDFLSPNPGNTPSPLVSIAISPRVGSLRSGEPIKFTAAGRAANGSPMSPEVVWNATGGSISQDGTFQADAVGLYSVAVQVRNRPDLRDSATVGVFNSPSDILQVVVSPDSVDLTSGDGAQFTATARLPDGSTVSNPPLAWSASRGQVDGSGWYSASGEGELWVRATASNGVHDSVKVRVKPRTSALQQIVVAPGVVTVASGATQQFSVSGWFEGGGTSEVSQVSWSATGGSITGSGRFTAGGSSGAHRVIAKYQGGALADTAFVTVTEPSVVSLAVSPGSATMSPGSNTQFTAVAGMSDGSTRAVGTSWQATGGSISQTGLHTASASPGTYRIIGQVAGTSLADTAIVTVSVPQATLTSLVLNPSVVAVPAGDSRSFSVIASYSDGSSRTPTVTWSATGGTIAPTGLFTAGAAEGSFRLIALDPGSGKADTSVVTVTPPALRQLVLNPASVELRPGESRQFAVSGLWTDGSASTPQVTWTGAGGGFSGAGLFTAGPAEGTFPVMVLDGESGLADTSYVTVALTAPALTALRVTPTLASLPLGGALQFAVTGIRSDGSVVPVPVVWSATGGAVSTTGLYTAGQGQGLWWVAARHASGLADSAQVQISVTAPVLTSMHLAPRTVSLQVNGTRQFSASGTLSDGSVASPVVNWTTNGGTITAGGLYLAPAVVGSYRVVARALTGGFADTALVTVTAPPLLVGLTVTPDSATLSRGGSRQFSATGLYSSGGTASVLATWGATGGTIGSSGLYAAGQISGSFRVIAQTGAVADTVPVQILGPVATGLVLTPESASLSLGGNRQFSTTTTWSDGGSYPSTVSYSATGGTITSGGMYTAGLTAGTFLVIASCSCGVADSSVVGIQAAAPAPVLSQLVLNPPAVTLTPGGIRALTVTALWSDGTTALPQLAWDATGGTMNAAVYTAGQAQGSYRIIVSDLGGTKADTTAISIQNPVLPPPAGDFVVYPDSGTAFILGPQLLAGSSLNPWPWFDQNMRAKGLEHGAAFPADPSTVSNMDGYINQNYYDLGLVLYGAYYRTGDVNFLQYARKVADSWWKSAPQEGANTNWDNGFAPRNVSLGGLMLRAIDGRPEMWPWITAYVRYQFNSWVGLRMAYPSLHYGVRDGGYMLLYAAWLAKAHPDPAVRAEFRQKALDGATQYYARLQYSDGSWRWSDAYAEAPTGMFMQAFMIGLLLDGMVATHRLTGDPRASKARRNPCRQFRRKRPRPRTGSLRYPE